MSSVLLKIWQFIIGAGTLLDAIFAPMIVQTAPKRLRSISESADVLGVSIPTLRRAIALNRIRSVTIGSRRLIADDEPDRVKREGLDLRKP